MKAKVVIGLNFGDEGKGLAVDALAASTKNPIVVRFNGGCQAGHTVQTPAGNRHVFHHVGAGALAGAPTFLSRHFLFSPGVFLKEHYALSQMIAQREVFSDPRAHVTTPFDIMLNRWAEEDRGDSRHGSCGEGINETVERGLAGFVITVGDLLGEPARLDALVDLVADYAAQRALTLGLRMTEERAIALRGKKAKASFTASAALMRGRIRPAEPEILRQYNPIFEGAQGLQLDQNNAAMFPHLTRSSTGMTNVAEICQEASITEADVLYMTRPYFTRHGAGPLPGAAESLRSVDFSDPTNQPSQWQGSMRLAPLNLDMMEDALERDLFEAPGMTLNRMIGISCLDQIQGSVDVDSGFAHCLVPKSAFVDTIGASLNLPVCFEGHGPTRETVKIRDLEKMVA